MAVGRALKVGERRVCSRWPTFTDRVGHRSVRACSRGTRLGPSRFALDLDAINLVDRPAIWGESGVSMMTSMPDPPYKISRNFKLQSCGPNLSWGAIKFVRLDKTITQSTLTERRWIEFVRGGQP